MNYVRNTSLSREIKSNDLYDLQLSIAIPYCDIVVSERQWINIAKHKHLDSKYESNLIDVHSFSDICDLLID